jgi:hypothetical protein
MTAFRPWLALAGLIAASLTVSALEKPETTYKVFQFPQDRIPRIDGDPSDWAMVPESYVIGSDQLTDDKKRHPKPDPSNLDVRVKVGWVKGLNRLYFLYEAYDDYWDYTLPDLHNDTFEIVVDGDASGGPLVENAEGNFWNRSHVGEAAAVPDPRISDSAAHWAIHGVHAQNYHIFTPHIGKDWCMAWGSPTWIKEFPWANAAQHFEGAPGKPGKYVLEFWITPFDYAGPEGPQRAVESLLTENKIIGLSWAVIDYDDVKNKNSSAFWNLSPKHTMFGDASELCAFRLMPMEPELLPKIESRWTWTVVDMDRRLIAFKDQSVGKVDSWKWDFGDGTSSTEKNPQHSYAKAGSFVVILDVSGPDGSSRRAKVRDVLVR